MTDFCVCKNLEAIADVLDLLTRVQMVSYLMHDIGTILYLAGRLDRSTFAFVFVMRTLRYISV